MPSRRSRIRELDPESDVSHRATPRASRPHLQHNTLPPSEDVLDARRHRVTRRRPVVTGHSSSSRELRENLVFLFLLALLVCATWYLCIHVFNL